MRLYTFLSTAHLRIFKKPQNRQHQQQQDYDNAIIRLPDEILLKILLLSVPSMGLEELRVTANVSQKFRRLSVDLMRRFMLPDVQLSTLIDQEGRRKFRTVYHFHSLNGNTFVVTFKPGSRQVPRRMRGCSHAALPVLHQLSVTAADNCTQPSLSPRSPIAEQDRQRPLDTIKFSFSSSTTSHHHSDGKIKIKPKSLRIAKPGNHVSGSSQKMSDAIRLWQLHYAVNTAEDSPDRYITPTAVRVHLSLLTRMFVSISQNGLPKKKAKAQQHMHQGNDDPAAKAPL